MWHNQEFYYTFSASKNAAVSGDPFPAALSFIIIFSLLLAISSTILDWQKFPLQPNHVITGISSFLFILSSIVINVQTHRQISLRFPQEKKRSQKRLGWASLAFILMVAPFSICSIGKKFSFFFTFSTMKIVHIN